MTKPNRNIELNARSRDLSAAASAAKRIGATCRGVLHQTDTYFRAPSGRLKLREIRDSHAELIWYARADSPELRDSSYYVVPIPDPALAKAALARAMGIRGVVAKCRELWMYHNVRVHLDEVDGLGTFIEFEAVVSSREDDAASHERLATLTEALGI